MSERGWVSIENAIEISRSPEDVFDYLTDIAKEMEWNPRTRRVEKLTSGPIGPGTGDLGGERIMIIVPPGVGLPTLRLGGARG